MRFVVFGGWFGSGNLGDDAILIGLRRILTDIYPDAEIVALSTDPKYTKRVCGVEAIPLLSPLSKIRRNGASVEAYLRTFRDADACIVCGGTPIYDYGHLSRTLHFGFPRALGTRLFCFGIGVKPIISRTGIGLTRALLRQAELISTRDLPSRDELMRLGVDKPVTVTGDSGLFLTPEKPEVGLRKLAECGVDTTRPMAAVCPRALSTDHRLHYHEPLSERAILEIRMAVAKAADGLSEEGYEVVFIPMHRVPPDDDIGEIKEVTGLMRSRTRKVVDVGLLPGEVMAVLGQMRIVLGLRLHSLVLAAAQGVPIVGVGYDRKIGGFMELAGVGDLVCPSPASSEVLIERVGRALDDRKERGRSLLRSCGEMRERVEGEARQLAALLE